MAWRLRTSAWQKGKGAGNKRAMKALILMGRAPGILAYSGRDPVGWCSISPREEFNFLSRSRVLAPIDDARVWSISCLFIKKEYRRQGVSAQLLKAATEYVKAKGGNVVEGYPVVPYSSKMPDAFAWTGLLSAYKKAGFSQVARRSKSRPIMRFYIQGRSRTP
jgi:GNAT superfamily N-acetyltransferase